MQGNSSETKIPALPCRSYLSAKFGSCKTPLQKQKPRKSWVGNACKTSLQIEHKHHYLVAAISLPVNGQRMAATLTPWNQHQPITTLWQPSSYLSVNGQWQQLLIISYRNRDKNHGQAIDDDYCHDAAAFSSHIKLLTLCRRPHEMSLDPVSHCMLLLKALLELHSVMKNECESCR